jgi:O-antigen/teichoic acid export membrane protein
LFIKAGPDRDWQIHIWKFSWPISVFGMFTFAQTVSDRWALGFFTTTQDVGLYAVLFQLGYYPMSIASGMVVQLLAPIFYQRAGDASDSHRNADVNSLSWRVTLFTLGVTVMACLIAFLFHEQIFRLFVARQYTTVSHLLPWILLAGGLFAAGQTMALNLQSQMKTRVMMKAKIITALLGVVFNLVGAYWYGTRGIVIAGVLFSLSYFLWMVVLSQFGE